MARSNNYSEVAVYDVEPQVSKDHGSPSFIKGLFGFNNRHAGLTLLELVIVLFILGLIAAIAVPAVGVLDDAARTRITLEKMEIIRRAILGPDDRFDARGRPVIGGYLGDMRAWPDLWEARAEIKPSFSGTGWETPTSMTSGLGQGPDYELDPSLVFYRPSGQFVKGRWQWLRPYRKLFDDSSGNDHIGGLAVENEGQPRGLWTRTPEDLPFDLTDHPAPGQDLGDNWKGPYLYFPADSTMSDSAHWAETDDEYEALEPLWHTTGAHANNESWEDGDYNPSTGELGEHYDDKEAFRLSQTEGRLTDGWGRALRFFITDDPDHSGSTIFWIVSEGPDGAGEYPTKGTCSGHAWTVDDTDTMATAYDDTASKNQDNIVLKLYSRDWEAIFEAERQEKETRTEMILSRLRAAVVGDSPTSLNTGFTGDLTMWPRLFQWEDPNWDDMDDSDVSYTKGQPRDLWAARPNESDTSDDLSFSNWGLGWRHGYVTEPEGYDAENVLRDAWGREILFFTDSANDALLILSRGADGLFAFGTVSSDNAEPEDFTEVVDVTTYDPSASFNTDNRHVIVSGSDWLPGFFQLSQFTVINAVLGDSTHGTTKACFFRTDGTPVEDVDLLTPTVLTDEDGDTLSDDWTVGDSSAVPAFKYDDTSAYKANTGARYLVFWNDRDDDDAIDSGEDYCSIIYNITAVAGSGQHDAVTINTDDFQTLP